MMLNPMCNASFTDASTKDGMLVLMRSRSRLGNPYRTAWVPTDARAVCIETV